MCRLLLCSVLLAMLTTMLSSLFYLVHIRLPAGTAAAASVGDKCSFSIFASAAQRR